MDLYEQLSIRLKTISSDFVHCLADVALGHERCYHTWHDRIHCLAHAEEWQDKRMTEVFPGQRFLLDILQAHTFNIIKS